MAKRQIRKDDHDLLTTSQMYFTSADNIRKPIEYRWDSYWRIFRNQYDFSRKSSWQSKQYVPKVSNAISLVKSILSEPVRINADFFTVDTRIENLKPYRHPIKELIMQWLDYNNFRKGGFSDSLTSALLCNLMIWKVFARTKGKKFDKYYTNAISHDTVLSLIKEGKIKSDDERLIEAILAEEKAEPINTTDMQLPKGEDRVCIEMVPIDPYLFRIDGSGRYRYVIEDIWYDLDEFKENSKKMGYNQNEIDKIEDGMKNTDLYKRKLRLAQGTNTYDHDVREVLVREYHGDLYTPKGDLVERNVTWTVANNQHVIREPVKNPNWHAKFPYVWGAPVRVPFSVYHKAYSEDIYGLGMAMTDQFNLLLDSNAYSVSRAFELDIDMVYDPEQLKTGVYPGKTFFKRSRGNPNAQMIKDVQLGSINPQSLRIYQEMDREFINAARLGTGGGTTSSKQRPTAREVEERSGISSKLMQDMAVDIEDGVIKPLLEMVYKTALQYQNDFNDPRMQNLSNEARTELQAFSLYPKDKKMEYIDAFQFEVGGISDSIAKQREMRKAIEVLTMAQQNPDKEFMSRVRKEYIWEKIFEGLGWDKSKAFLSEEEYQKKVQKQQSMMEKAKIESMRQQMALKQAEEKANVMEQSARNQLELKQNNLRFAQELQHKTQRHELDMLLKSQKDKDKKGGK